MISQLIGAVVRAVVVFIVISTPSLLIPWTGAETIQIVMLLGVFAALFTFSEYSSTYPALLEFRDAAPFNRIRVLALFATVFTLSLVAANEIGGSTLTLVLNASGLIVTQALDFSYAPLRLLLDQIPSSASPETVLRAQAMVGVATIIGLFSVTIFAILTRLQSWPRRKSSLNVWVNLPTFDPNNCFADIVSRLKWLSRVNILLGFVLPFVIPVVVNLAATHLGLTMIDSTQTMVWVITLWMFLPLNMFMRGMAMARVAEMITERRRRLVTNPEPFADYATS